MMRPLLDKREAARKLYQEDKKSYNEIVKILGVAKSSVSHWCRDLVDHKGRNVKKSRDNEELKQKIRSMYRDDKMTTPQIAELLNMSESIVYKWCADLSKERRQTKTLIRRPNSKDLPKVRSHNAVLEDDAVIKLRRLAKQQGRIDCQAWADSHNVKPSTIDSAVRGQSFQRLNDIEAPYRREDTARQKEYEQKILDREAIVREALALFHSDPIRWDFTALGVWLSEKTGKTYKAGPVGQLLRHRDPSVAAINPPKPKREKKPRVPKIKKVLTTEDIIKRRQEEAALRKAIRDADRHEAWVNAGCPADWVQS